METKFKSSLKVMGLAVLGLMMMGNKGCEEPPVVEDTTRRLKWFADAGAIKSPPVKFGEVGNFDFGFVASEQLYGVLYNSGGFATSIKDTGFVQGPQGVEIRGAQKLYKQAFGKTTISEKLYYSSEARCLIALPDVKINGSVLSYEMTSGNNISFGFNQNTGTAHSGFGIGANLAVKVKDLSIQLMGLSIAKDMNSSKYKVIAAPLVHEMSKDTEGQIKLDFSGFGLGYGWYKNTALATITERALTTGVKKVKAEMDKVPWTTKILDLNNLDGEDNPFGDAGFIVKGGADVNLKVGDVVEFYEDKTMWKENKPCDSDFLGYFRMNERPIAVGEVRTVDQNFSLVLITKRNDDRPILPGYRIQLLKAVEDVQKEKAAAETGNKTAKK